MMTRPPMRAAIVLGTRPEIIKMAPIIDACARFGMDAFILHTGQHYSANLDAVFFEQLRLPVPAYNMGIGNQPHRKQVGLMTHAIRDVLARERPDVVIVQGDTITVLAATLAARWLGITVAHHEAGLRSHDPTMIEETNRVTTDHLSRAWSRTLPTWGLGLMGDLAAHSMPGRRSTIVARARAPLG